MKEFIVHVADQLNCKERKFASRICQSDHNCLRAAPGMGGVFGVATLNMILWAYGIYCHYGNLSDDSSYE
jgi:hypothetical protein